MRDTTGAIEHLVEMLIDFPPQKKIRNSSILNCLKNCDSVWRTDLYILNNMPCLNFKAVIYKRRAWVNNTDSLIDLALKEDGVFNDITTKEFIPKDKWAKAVLIANSPGILCGADIFIKVFKTIDKKCKVLLKMKDSSQIKRGDKILEITGYAYTILSGERAALNFLQYMSGIATLTNKFVTSINNGRTKIYDTRKTIPGYRELAKYAVRCGGGTNHRMGLYDEALIKDNHLKFMKNLTAEISEFRKKHKSIPVEVECENIKQVKQALDSKADIIMVDNMTFENTK